MIAWMEETLSEVDRVLAVISKAYLAALYSKLELRAAVYASVEKPGFTLPVLIEPCKPPMLLAIIKRCTLYGVNEPEARQLLADFLKPSPTQTELAFLDKTNSTLSAPAFPGTKQRNSPLIKVGGAEDVLGWGWDGSKLLEELIKLDYSTIEALTHIQEGDPQQWGPIFMDHWDTWRMLFVEPTKIVGYWHMAPLFEEDYEKAKSGKLLDSEITPDRVQHFEIPGHYNAYFVQVCMLQEDRGPTNMKLLYETFFETLNNLAKNGVFIKEIAANAMTNAGISLCRQFNMSLVCAHEHGGTVYSASFRDICRSFLVKRFPELLELYSSEGLI